MQQEASWPMQRLQRLYHERNVVILVLVTKTAPSLKTGTHNRSFGNDFQNNPLLLQKLSVFLSATSVNVNRLRFG